MPSWDNNEWGTDNDGDNCLSLWYGWWWAVQNAEVANIADDDGEEEDGDDGRMLVMGIIHPDTVSMQHELMRSRMSTVRIYCVKSCVEVIAPLIGGDSSARG